MKTALLLLIILTTLAYGMAAKLTNQAVQEIDAKTPNMDVKQTPKFVRYAKDVGNKVKGFFIRPEYDHRRANTLRKVKRAPVDPKEYRDNLYKTLLVGGAIVAALAAIKITDNAFNGKERDDARLAPSTP